MKTFLLIATFSFSSLCFSQTYLLTETHRGEYEDGSFKATKPEFKFRIVVSRERRSALLSEITRLSTGDIIDIGIQYQVAATDSGTSLSRGLFSPSKRQETMHTFIGHPGSLATEIFYVGETFFEYCKIANGRLYLSHGTVQKAMSASEEAEKQFQKK